jgi:hypothetical protein
MEQNQRRTAQEWGDIFSDWRKSGESQRGYCRREGIPISAFGYWHRKLERHGEQRRLVRVGSLPLLPGAGRNGFTARAGGIQVDLSGQESEELLVKVFRALKGVS